MRPFPLRRNDAHPGHGLARSGAIALACCATLVAVHSVSAQTVARSFTHSVKAGSFAEECLTLPAGASIGYAFDATVPVDFNIHLHRGSAVEYPVRADQVREANDRFTAASAEEYCLMWTNRTAQTAAVKGTIGP